MSSGQWPMASVGNSVFSAGLPHCSGLHQWEQWGAALGAVGSGSGGQSEWEQWGVGVMGSGEPEWEQWGVGVMGSGCDGQWV